MAFVGMNTQKQTWPAYESLAQASQRTGLSIRTLRRRIADGSLPAYRNGPRVIRVKPVDVDRLLQLIPVL